MLWLIIAAASFTMNPAVALTSTVLSNELLIDKRIMALFRLTDYEPDKINLEIKELTAKLDSFNAAERHLILQILSDLAINDDAFTDAIDFREQAHLLDEKIPEEQLNQPIFAKSHLTQATLYAQVGNYNKAYLEKKVYLTKYRAYTKNNRNKTVDLLSKKYETEHKVKTNELLLNQNKLRELQLQEVARKNSTQRTNIILIACTMVVFLLLFCRQLQVSKKLTLLTQTDSLTNLLNRRALFEQGKQLIKSISNENNEMSVVVVDIDHFKKVNDRYGHAVGDSVLQQVALVGCEVMRSRDIFARSGGEEFVALLPEASLEEAKAIAERLKEKMLAIDLVNVGVKEPITLSLGIASVKQVIADFDILLHAADQAMYQAKLKGRNQVAIYHV